MSSLYHVRFWKYVLYINTYNYKIHCPEIQGIVLFFIFITHTKRFILNNYMRDKENKGDKEEGERQEKVE